MEKTATAATQMLYI